MKKLSVIIPCYNMEKYIERCYRSLVEQKDADDVEFIFVNDGSNDNTLSILQDIKAKDSRVVVVSQNNAGVSVARNAALTIANGEYVYLLDGDDYLTKNALFEIKQVLNEFHPDILISAYNISKNNTERFISLPFEEGLYYKKDFFAKIPLFPTAPQLVYRMDVIKEQNIRFDSSIKCGEVYAFTINYIRYIDKIFVLNKPTFNYYQRTDSAIHNPNFQNDITVIKALSSIYHNGVELEGYGAFVITAFKLMCAFSYNKYLKYSSDVNAVATIEKVISSDIAKRCIKDTLLKRHKFLKERMIALYMYIMPKRMGFQFLHWIIRR